jgi:C-terminal processing protease CtpA/Prc
MRCSFDSAAPQDLRWRRASEDLDDAYWMATRSATIGPPATGGVAFPAQGVAWVGIPSFAPVGDDADALGAAIRMLRERGDALRAGRAIVLDLRGNTGGTSMMADNLADAIWGSSTVTQHRRPTNEAVDWRASPENARYVGRFSLLLRLRFPNSDVGRTWADVIAPGLRDAHRRGAPFFRQGASQPAPSGGASANRTRGTPPFPARVVFLTNGTCASACLDFADIALNIPGTIHVGEHTAGDGLLMEVRSIDLPSGRGSVATPIKVVRGRARGSMESYAPDVAYIGPWIDGEVRAWVLSLVERGDF